MSRVGEMELEKEGLDKVIIVGVDIGKKEGLKRNYTR
jgi:hypothetical protein